MQAAGKGGTMKHANNVRAVHALALGDFVSSAQCSMSSSGAAMGT
jgi:hypothetical protein